MVDKNRKASLIRHIQRYISLMKMNNIILVLHTCNILSSFMLYIFLMQATVRLALLEIIFLSSDFHELWHSMMSICLLTQVKWQWDTLGLVWVTASVHFLCL